jgi:UDP-4-keto-D-QuiNAc 4-reductase
LTSSLTVDSRRVRADLGWTPRYRVDDGLAETARWYVAKGG